MLRTLSTWTLPEGGGVFTTLYFGGSTEGEAAAAVAATNTLWTGLDVCVTSAASVSVGQEVEQVDPATGQITNSYATAGASNTFTGTGDVLPWATQGLLRWRTGQFINGRELRGRTFVPGVLEAHSTGGVPSAGFTTNAATAIAAFLTAAAPAGDFQIYSPTHGQAADVSSGTPWNLWAVLRSRRQ